MTEHIILKTLALGLGLSAVAFLGCKQANDVLGTDISGQVLDDRGDPVAGATVRLYGLLENTNFVEGGDVYSAQAYIDRDAVLASNNTLTQGETKEDGSFKLSAIPNAFFAVVLKDTCSPGFAGFDDETGVLNVDTLITPNLRGGLNFEIPRFKVTCATPPDVSDEGNASDAPVFDPPPATVSCDAAACGASGGTCVEDTCVATCVAASCAAAGGSCVGGACVAPTCDPSACQAAGGACASDGVCSLPACSSDETCNAGQPGAFCENPGDVALAACHAPLPEEIVPPVVAVGWTGCRITDSNGTLLVDASAEGKVVAAAALPADGIIRVYGDISGAATKAYVQVQSGGASCPNSPPRTDFIPVDIAGGQLATDKGGYLELSLHGGYQRVQLSTSDTLGAGERSFVVQFGTPCAPPAHDFTAILTWDAGHGDPIDLDLNVWNGDGNSLCVGRKKSNWGQLRESKCPGPEVFESDDASQGPFTIKVQSFCGRQRTIQGKVRIIRRFGGQLVDKSYVFNIAQPGDVAEIGVFAAE
ncbi:MAG: hypothetical protein ABI895_07275 [Deltaproteobacteria bacterium]